ncbi:hypothetical protein [Natrialba taiwanensis]|uniref:Uncharacterized protein n=1 Tax=Natrialba taiwanensis DSM 12281 TaxID=1230458 RepID=L9ZYU2_9EURY|nr:hypothetical protein [Natrialba taiwanensis]ELY91484.1 hypothetical protein C484_10666 [Natrialba taiwanensis DSM 12281]
MTTWVESSNTLQDGSPVSRRIKIDEISEEVWFTDNAYAEVSDDVADILANNLDSITKVSEPSDPGTYYNEDNANTTIEIIVEDGTFDAVTAEVGDIDDLSTEQMFVLPTDLSQVSGSDTTLHLHDGTNSITLADGSTTSNVGYYRWDESASGWRQIGQDADTVDGYHGDQLAKLAGDTFTGSVRVDTDGEDALLELLTAAGSQYFPTLHLGGDQDNGIRSQHEPDTGMGRIGTVDAGTFTGILNFDPAAGNASFEHVRDIDVGSYDDSFESALRVLRNGSAVGWLDNSGSNVRLKAAASSSAELINNNNNGLEVTPSDKISLGGNDFGDLAEYSDDTAPSNSTLFFDTTDSQVEYKDSNGTNHVLG